MAVALESIGSHRDVPSVIRANWGNLCGREGAFDVELGVSKYEFGLPGNLVLPALLINQGSDTLLVCLHGASNRDNFNIPRFEWMRTVRELPYNALFFSDPGLDLHPRISLSWYTGTFGVDLYPILGEMIQRAVAASGSRRVIILGSSGGGFAALQTAPYVPGAVALPFSPQTSISGYFVGREGLGAQRMYLRVVMPELKPDVPLEGLWPDVDWAEPLGPRLSACVRYAEAQSNSVVYMQNRNDVTHMEQHYAPFREVVTSSPNRDRVKFHMQDGPKRHNPPFRSQFLCGVELALAEFTA